jgi:hypothetical protein
MKLCNACCKDGTASVNFFEKSPKFFQGLTLNSMKDFNSFCFKKKRLGLYCIGREVNGN